MKNIGMAVVTVQAFRTSEGVSTDKNGKQNVILIPVAGRIPNRQVLAGTVAEQAGLEIGKTYLVNITKLEPDDKQAESRNLEEFPHQFNWTKLSEMSPLDIIKAPKDLGAPVVFNVEKDVDGEPQTNKKGLEAGGAI